MVTFLFIFKYLYLDEKFVIFFFLHTQNRHNYDLHFKIYIFLKVLVPSHGFISPQIKYKYLVPKRAYFQDKVF